MIYEVVLEVGTSGVTFTSAVLADNEDEAKSLVIKEAKSLFNKRGRSFVFIVKTVKTK